MVTYLDKKSQCEKCFNKNCREYRKRNVNWDGIINYCNSFQATDLSSKPDPLGEDDFQEYDLNYLFPF
jgi:hypothetical protein